MALTDTLITCATCGTTLLGDDARAAGWRICSDGRDTRPTCWRCDASERADSCAPSPTRDRRRQRQAGRGNSLALAIAYECRVQGVTAERLSEVSACADPFGLAPHIFDREYPDADRAAVEPCGTRPPSASGAEFPDTASSFGRVQTMGLLLALCSPQLAWLVVDSAL